MITTSKRCGVNTRSKQRCLKRILYSFRHIGAINVFEETVSLATLQQVMGHSNIEASLTYLRGLELKQLDVEDLPELYNGVKFELSN